MLYVETTTWGSPAGQCTVTGTPLYHIPQSASVIKWRLNDYSLYQKLVKLGQSCGGYFYFIFILFKKIE